MLIAEFIPGTATTVEIDMEVRSMGQISEMDMVRDSYYYKIHCLITGQQNGLSKTFLLYQDIQKDGLQMPCTH